VTPTELQYPGRTDLLERTPLGRGLIVVDEKMDSETLARTIYAYLATGNEVRLLVHRSREEAMKFYIQGLRAYGFSGKQLSIETMLIILCSK
jgi:hypothetical protein